LVQIGELYYIAAIRTIGSESTSNEFCKKRTAYRPLQGYPNFGAPKLACAIYFIVNLHDTQKGPGRSVISNFGCATPFTQKSKKKKKL